ncbi:MAG: elongation factor P [Deltaproteobacteria bacterium]
MLITATQLRVGMVIMHNGELQRVFHVMHVTPGNWRGMVQTKLRNLRTANSSEHRFASSDKVDRATLEQNEMEYLYSDGEVFHFMNTENYEQIELTSADLGKSERFLLPNMKIDVESFEGKPLGVSLPKNVDLEVKDTAPAIKGATAAAQLKPATTETGLVVQVPSFISVGDVIRVATESGDYVSRAKD